MAYRRPRFTVPFKNDEELDDNFIPSVLPSRRTTPFSNSQNFRYQDPAAERGASDYRSEIDKLYGTGEAMEKFYSHAQNVPRREDYGPGILDRIVAGLAGTSAGYFQGAGAGVGTAQKIIRRPYEQALEEYELKGQGLKAAADIEQDRDAKRVAYLKELRMFDQDEYKRVVAEMDAESRRINAEANAEQARTRQRLAELTEARDKAVDERERKRISNEIKRTENNLKVQTDANAIRREGVKAVDRRTEMLGKRPTGRTTVRFASPQAHRVAEIDAAQELLNDAKYSALKPFVDLAGPNGLIIDNEGKSGFMGFGVSKPDPTLMEQFKKELEERKKRRLNTVLSQDDDDSIDFDLDEDL